MRELYEQACSHHYFYSRLYFKVLLGSLRFLPRKGYKCLTVDEKTHAIIKKRAMENNLTIRAYVENLLADDKAAKYGKIAAA